MKDITLRYAQNDADVVAIHGFLCIVAGPYLPGTIDPKESATEVWRVVNEEMALMAIYQDRLIGTIGLIRPKFWWAKKTHFLVNRWFFTLKGTNVGYQLLKESIDIAKASELELHIVDEKKQRYRIFNRHPRRDRPEPIIGPPIRRELPPVLH